MQQYKIIIAYDGTAYHGWQLQPEAPTVVGMLERRFNDVFKKNIKIIGASRTDAGVHALGQVACFSLDSPIPSAKMLWAWNNALPQDILIRSCEEVADFHPQRHVSDKTYYYHLFKERPLPFLARYGFHSGPFDDEKLAEAAQIFTGTHDFRSFCTGYERENTVRTVHAISVRYLSRYRVYRIEVRGPGFLRYMIRRIVGACLDVASAKHKPLEVLEAALAERNPHQHLFVVPAQGLMLYHIDYASKESTPNEYQSTKVSPS